MLGYLNKTLKYMSKFFCIRVVIAMTYCYCLSAYLYGIVVRHIGPCA